MSLLLRGLVIVSLVTVSAAACGPEPSDTENSCAAGEERACTCADGRGGVERCGNDGLFGECGCGPTDAGSLDLGVGPDATGGDLTGTPDAGTADRGDTGPEAGLPDLGAVDGWAPEVPTLRSLVLPERARGPVAVQVDLITPYALELTLEFDDGDGFAPATLFEAGSDVPTPTPINHVIEAVLVWDSYTDVPGDSPVTLRLVGDADGTPEIIGDPVAIEIANDPEGTRLLLAAHPSGMDDSGGLSHVGTQVSVLTISGDGTGADTGQDVTVGVGPDQLAFAPDGALAVVRNSREGTLSLLDVEGSIVTPRATPLSLAPLRISDFVIAPDARSLYVAASGSGVYSLVEYDLLSGVPVEQRSVDFDTLIGGLAISPRGDYLAISRNDMDNDETRFLEILDRRGLGKVGILPYAGGICQSLRYSADGRFVGTTNGMITDYVTLIDVSSPTVPRHLVDVGGIHSAYDVVFHPAGDALLVSVLGDDAVVPYSIAADLSLTAGTAVSGGLPQAAEMDMLLRGAREGLTAVSALSSVVLVQLRANGTAVKIDTIDTGPTYEDGVQGVAVSP